MENDPGAADELRAMGLRSVPVTVVGDLKIVGFRPKEISEALQLGLAAPPPRDPSETILLLERVLVAIERAIKQMPDDKLDWHAPDRERPMREFAYHMFRMAQRTMGGITTGVFPMEDATTMDLPGRSYKSFQEIAKFGREVIEDYRAWAPKQDPAQLRKSLGPGLRSGAEQLDLITGHNTQHLRQLYFVLRQFGIDPIDPIKDEELPPEYVLTILW